MKRLLLIALIFMELTAAAVFAVALRFGRFDQGAGFYFYLAGPLLAIATACGLLLPLTPLRRVASHGLLLLGCLLFSLPFVWLVSTSFKYEEEVFVYPPQWIPSTPGVVAQSPYVTSEEFAGIERPAALSEDRWEEIRGYIEEALWQKGAALLGDRVAMSQLETSAVRERVVRGLWHGVLNRSADTLWAGNADQIPARLGKQVDAELANLVWESVYRAVELNQLTIADDEGIERSVIVPGASDQGWRAISNNIHLIHHESATSTASETQLLRYDLKESSTAKVEGKFAMDIAPDRLFSIRLPMRQDRSWNRFDFTLEAGGRRYVLEDALFLGQRRWQELTFKIKAKDDRDDRDEGVWPLVPATDQTGAYNVSAMMKLTITIHRASTAGAVWSKYTNNYRQAYLSSGQRWNYVFNSLYLVVLSVLGQMLSCSMVSYAFARIRWPGRDILFFVLLATMMLPAQVTMVPTFVIFKYLGWYNTLKALWIPSFFGAAFFIFMMRQFMRGIPNDLEEAARIDGCGYFGIYWRIILPLMKPALAAVAIFTFMGTWNDFMGPLIYINDERLYPLSLGLFEFRTQHSAEYGMLMAASTLMTLPVIAVFFVAQRYFIQGITLTGMKG